MNKQVKITINNKECYCDEEVFKYILRISNKMEELEYNIYKAIEYIENPRHEMSVKTFQELSDILRGEDNESNR